MSLERINKLVVSYCEIPEDIKKPDWIEEASNDAYVECHLDGDNESPLDEWLVATYPELKEEDSFFIHIDY